MEEEETMMKAEDRVKLLQAKEHKRLSENHQKLGQRPGTDPQSSDRTNPVDTLTLKSEPPEL